MIKYAISVFIFSVILFLYLHINYHLKCSNDLEVYTIESPSKETLEEICNIRQPVVFDFYNENLMEDCNIDNLENEYGAFDINLRDKDSSDKSTELYLPFLLKEALTIFREGESKKYFSEKNQDFLTETGLIKKMQYNDGFLRPPLVSKCEYDLMCGEIGVTTPLRYNVNYRNYFYSVSGEIEIKLVPPSKTKYLYESKDYDNFEFISPLNIWDVQDKYKNNFEKIKVLDITLTPGQIIYIPAYWWYTIRFKKYSSICKFSYRTFMSSLSILPDLFLKLLQQQNVKREQFEKLEKIPTIQKNNKNEETLKVSKIE